MEVPWAGCPFEVKLSPSSGSPFHIDDIAVVEDLLLIISTKHDEVWSIIPHRMSVTTPGAYSLYLDNLPLNSRIGTEKIEVVVCQFV